MSQIQPYSPLPYYPTPISPQHYTILQQHRDVLLQSYNIPEQCSLKILSVEQKQSDPKTGQFYKFTIKDNTAKTYVLKIEKPRPDYQMMERLQREREEKKEQIKKIIQMLGIKSIHLIIG